MITEDGIFGLLALATSAIVVGALVKTAWTHPRYLVRYLSPTGHEFLPVGFACRENASAEFTKAQRVLLHLAQIRLEHCPFWSTTYATLKTWRNPSLGEAT